ncbi:hypothetical protein Tco_1344389 [Tanacetum coccineum]
MGRGTGIIRFGGVLAIIDAFVRSEVRSSVDRRGTELGVRTYLLVAAIDGSGANGIIREPKFELESSFVLLFDLVGW